jgi:hypothetical protein
MPFRDLWTRCRSYVMATGARINPGPQRYASLAVQVGEGSALTFLACGSERNAEPDVWEEERNVGCQTGELYNETLVLRK